MKAGNKIKLAFLLILYGSAVHATLPADPYLNQVIRGSVEPARIGNEVAPKPIPDGPDLTDLMFIEKSKEYIIDNIEVTGNYSPDIYRLLKWYGHQICRCSPICMEDLERYVLLAGDIPGMHVRAMLSPSKSRKGARNLTFVVSQKKTDGYISANNYGAQFLGAQQYTLGGDLYSAGRVGDSTNLQIVTSGDEKLNFIQIQHSQLVTEEGWRLNLLAHVTHTKPGGILSTFQTKGNNQSYAADLTYPIIRSCSQNLYLRAGLLVLNSETSFNGSNIYNDHIRSLYIGNIYTVADHLGGINELSWDYTQGIPLGNGSTVNNFSRPAHPTQESILHAFVARNQYLPYNFSFYIAVRGQEAFHPLLAASQFGFGGNTGGRGFDPSEITGNTGIGGTVELRYDPCTYSTILKETQLYAFYDAGRVWGASSGSLGPTSMNITSSGIGARIKFTNHGQASLYIAQPLTFTPDTIQNRTLRAFFVITLWM